MLKAHKKLSFKLNLVLCYKLKINKYDKINGLKCFQPL